MGLIDDIQVLVNGCGCLSILSALATYTTRVLKPNVSEGTNTLSQLDFDSRNVKYVIKWDYDLLGQTITIPEGCLIEFDGGSISNGTLIGNNTTIISYLENEDIFKNVELDGTFKYTKFRQELLDEILESFGLTISESDIILQENEKIIPHNKTVTITDGKGHSVSFDTIILEKQQLEEYTVTLNLTGGTMTDFSYTYNELNDTYIFTTTEDLTVSLPTPIKTGYRFIKWNTKADGTGVSYNAGNISMLLNLILYAVWVLVHTVTINANNGSTPNPAIYNNVDHGSNITLPPATTRSLYTFLGWNTQADGSGTNYNAGATFNVTSNITLYAKWEVASYTVLFNLNGGSGINIEPVTGNHGTVITLPSYSGSRTGYSLRGKWNTKLDGTGTDYDFGSEYTLTLSTTLYIKWGSILNRYYLSTTAPQSEPNWSESDGSQTTLLSLLGWNNWKNLAYNINTLVGQYISFPNKSSENINDYILHLDDYNGSLNSSYTRINSSVLSIILFRWNERLPLGDSNANNLITIK